MTEVAVVLGPADRAFVFVDDPLYAGRQLSDACLVTLRSAMLDLRRMVDRTALKLKAWTRGEAAR